MARFRIFLISNRSIEYPPKLLPLPVKNIRLTTDRSIDFHSLSSIAASIIKANMSGEEKALACYHVVRRHMFQYPWPYDEAQGREEWHDAVKLLRTYGHGLCGVQARVLGALYREVFGRDNQRLTGLGERQVGDWAMDRECGAFYFSLQRRDHSLQQRQGHTTVEVFYDGHWHHLDPMVEFYAYTRDGSRIASLDESLADPTLVTRPSRHIEGLMPDGDISKVYYASTLPQTWKPGPDYYIVRDTEMDFSLQPGHTARFFWDKPHGAFFWPRAVARDFPQAYFEKGPRHPDPAQGAWRHYGNGCLSAAEVAVPVPGRLHFNWPYVLVGGRLQVQAHGSDLKLQAAGAQDRPPIPLPAGPNTLDLALFVNGGYGLDLSFSGTGHIRNLQLDLYFQHNFIAAPRLLPGSNLVHLDGEAESPDEQLEITWAWQEAGDHNRRCLQRLQPWQTYALEVGQVDTDPPQNPKYMHSLTLSTIQG